MNTWRRGFRVRGAGPVLSILTILTLQTLCAATRYVWPGSPSPGPPYDTWDTAAHTIQAAVDDTLAGETVLVTNGVYATGGRPVGTNQLLNRVTIDRAITVVSVHGPEVTVIVGAEAPGGGHGNGAVRCAYVGPLAVLNGFTLTNGHTRTTGDRLAEQSGGGVSCEGSAVVTNCLLTGNSAFDHGGGALWGKLYDCTLSGNAARYGGGTYWSALFDCTLTNNSASESGGGASGGSTRVLSGCTLINNSAARYGGGAYGLTLSNCTLIGNRATDSGGGAAGLTNNPDFASTLHQCTLEGNRAEGLGGGAWDSTLYDCVLTNNSAGRSGGGSSGGRLDNCALTGNAASLDGGGAFWGMLRNCTVTGNSAGSFGGGARGWRLYNCTVTGNLARHAGGVAEGELYNCIVYSNLASFGPNYQDSAFQYSCTAPLPPGGTGNIADEPQLASATHLSAGSPCIDAGSAASASGVDVDGEAWADPPCMGADQFVTGVATGALAMAIEAAYTNVAVGFAAPFVAHSTGRLTASVWDFQDGTVVSNQPYLRHVWPAAGTYAVRLTGYNDSYPAGVIATAVVRVVERPVHYVDQASVAPQFPYTNWGTAARSIQSAVDAGNVAGRLVLVADGVYNTGGRAVHGTLTNRVAIDRGVTVQSANGPEVTIIRGTPATGGGNGHGAIRCAYLGADAVLSGFTLANGHTRTTGDAVTERCGGGVWCEVPGTVSNCWLGALAGNSASQDGGGAYGGTLHGCILMRNSAHQGGGAYASTLHNCQVSDNSATGTNAAGGGAYDCVLSNCTLRGNSAVWGGGGAEQSTLYTCTLMSNSVSGYPGGGICYGGGAHDSTLYKSTLSGNHAGWQGGGARGGTLYNCTVSSNSADFGGGAYAAGLYHCTVTGNSASDGGGGVQGYAPSSPCRLYNCIVYYNAAPVDPEHGPYSDFSYSATMPLPTGQGNITNEPAFVDRASGDLRLAFGSPGIDAGTNLAGIVSDDLDGHPRPLDGDGDGAAAFDLGAYEFLLPAADSNRDGIPDGWTYHYGLNPADPNVGAGNPDRDGQTTFQEWVADTNPTNEHSYFWIEWISNGPPVSVYFQGSSNRVYTLFHSSTLPSTPAGWSDVAGQADVPGTGGLDMLTDTNAAPANFYRVGVRVP